MRGARAWDVLVLILVVATVYVLVRPRSRGAELVNAVSKALVAIVANAADLAGGN